ncbi:hypothetical protein TWF730_003994 [Orbilia blumenaviensis]|uniref:Uncharacterized protein n=1 Tax=Orbilia blumenaviensis TaxID=1796055 RepID=A0AAV9U1Y8_9PEZI
MKFIAAFATALGFAGSVAAAPAPAAAECKTPAVFTHTVRLSPIHTVYKNVIREVTRIPCEQGCTLELKTVTSTHPKWDGKVTATVTHKEQHTPVPICDLIIDLPDPADEKEDDKDDDKKDDKKD